MRSRASDEYRLLVESVVDYAIYRLDPEGRVVTWNSGAQRIKGYTHDEVVGRNVSLFYPEEERASGTPARDLEIAAREGRLEREAIRVRKDGTRFWAHVALTALRDEAGALLGFAKVTRDLTERKQMELAEQGRAQLEAILNAVGDGIMVQDRSFRIRFINEVGARLSGLSNAAEVMTTTQGELLTRFEILGEDGKPLPPEQLPIRRALAGEETPSAVLCVRERASGRTTYSFVRASPIRNAEGEPVLAVAVSQDISERRREEEARRYLYETTATLLRSLDYEVTLAALARQLVPQLADWCAIDVLEDDELKRLAVAHVDPEKVRLAHELHLRYPPDMSEGARGIAHVLRTGEPEFYPNITDEMIVRSARDPEHLELSRSLGLRSAMIVPIRARDVTFGAMTLIAAESGRQYDERDLALASELATRAGIAIENARLYRDAQRAIELRDEFLSIAGHELRTPLAALDLQLHALHRAFESGAAVTDTPKWTERLGKTVAHAKRLKDLINDLLDVSRITSGGLALHREKFDLSVLCHEIVERHRELVTRGGSRIDLTHVGDTHGEWDRARMDQVISNLLENAVKYGNGKPIAIDLHRRKDVVVVCVRDEGIGIAPEHQHRIFGRFERAVSALHYGGLGLGLWISREIVAAHGGKISFDSEPGKGTTFTVELPVQ